MHTLEDHFPLALKLLTADLGAKEGRFVLERMSAARYAVGERVVREGRFADALYYVIKGRLEASVEADGHRLGLAEIVTGEWIGEMTFVEPAPASATVTCLEPAVLLRMRNADITELCDENPAACATLLTRICQALAERLVLTGSGMLEQVADTEYRVAVPDATAPSMVERLLRLFWRQP